MLIDTHCHLNIITKSKPDIPLTEQDFEKSEKILSDARNNGVYKILNVGTSVEESKNCITLAKKFKDVYPTIGVHPNDLDSNYKKDIQELEKLLKTYNTPESSLSIKAIGECGFDYHYPQYDKEIQKDGFKAQVELALEYDLPIIIHTRDAGDTVLRVLEEFKDSRLRGVIHCFSEGMDFAKKAVELNFKLGFGGTVTYPRNKHLREVAQKMGIDHIVLETDAPFLPPQAIRGKTNYPSQIRTIAEYLADLLNVNYTTVAEVTTQNAEKLFNI